MMTELDARSNRLARQAECEGEVIPIRFQFVESDDGDLDRKMKSNEDSSSNTTTVDIPEVCFVNILQYLEGSEIMHNTSLVSKVWLSASRLSLVWEDGVDMSRLNFEKKVLNMTSFLKLLERPQFARLKALAFPYSIKLGVNSVKQLAKILPRLEVFDTGYFHSGANYSKKTSCTDTDLIAATEHFTNLTSLRIDMAKVTSNGIKVAVMALGERLVELKLHADSICRNYLSGGAMETIISSCPNLKHFAYSCEGGDYNEVTGDRVVDLVRGCRCLESLGLCVRDIRAPSNVKRSHFLQIANLVANDLDGYALRKIVADGYSKADKLVSDPFDIQTLLAEYTFLEVENKFVQTKLENGIFFTEQKKDPVKEAAKNERASEMKECSKVINRQHDEAVRKLLAKRAAAFRRFRETEERTEGC